MTSGPGGTGRGETPVIAIDGASATGKTTTAAALAERLGLAYVDSGAIYRAVALALDRAGADPAAEGLAGILGALDLEVRPRGTRFEVRMDGRPVGDEIRTPEVTRLSSRFAVRGEVRERVRQLLRDAAAHGPLVVEGRDIGTEVFPDARLKVYLIADTETRARRRCADLARLGREVPLEEVRRELVERDRRDSTRDLAPLRRAADALVLDNSRATVEEQVAILARAWAERSAPPEGGAGEGPAEG